jgi:mono/diheme cytochrome c family protein
LGFAPLQIRRRPKASAQISDGAIIEDTNTDELSQFQRLIDYGVITGATSEDDVVKLEESEVKPPRNVYELNAQGYMTGNCGHCHNPRGYPSISHPELADVLKFWPSMESGIFGFDINTVSPRTHRGLDGEFAVPYISQSIDDTSYGDTSGVINPAYTPKLMTMPPDASGQSQTVPVLAPWRSLIYRNVDTPFPYTEAGAVFPHMPLNTPGYDCRVPQIMGDWMVSIPVQRVRQGPVDPSEILPYTESLPTDTYYSQHVQEASERLAQYHASYRYNFCPDTSDIVDPEVVSGKELTPQDNGYPLPGYTAAQVALSPIPQSLVFKDGVPDRPHWVVTDPTENPGPWVPRRPDYGVALFGDPPATGDMPAPQSDDLKVVVKIVGQGSIVYSQDFNDNFALLPRPLAYWNPAPQGATADQLKACATALAAQKPASSYTGTDRLPWLDSHQVPAWWPAGSIPGANTPVYEASIAETVFNEICINCHGPNADGKSALADTLLELTGGSTRVADLRDGLLGPTGAQAGDNRARVFAAEATLHNLTTDDVAVRYLAFMGLGGTEKPIPDSILQQVANTPVFGERRDWVGSPPPATANMLATARSACLALAPTNTLFDVTTGLWPEKYYSSTTPLLASSADGDMWQLLCYKDNPGPVLALEGDQWLPMGDPTFAWNSFQLFPSHRFDRSTYPPNYPVGGAGGVVYPSLTDDNVLPWCVVPPGVEVNGNIPSPDAPAQYQAQAEALWFGTGAHQYGRTDPIPYCPWVGGDSPVSDSQSFWDATGRPDQTKIVQAGQDADIAWSIRGAANAGRAVFAYIDGVAKGTVTPRPHFDQCYLVTSSGM